MAQIASLKIEDIVKILPKNTGTQINQVAVEVQKPADVFKVFKKEAYRLPSLSPAHVKHIELKSGEWGNADSIRQCTYVVKRGLTDKTEKLVDQVINADDPSIAVYKVLEGDITDHYKNVYAILRIIESNAFDGFAHWVLVYEKKYQDICPCPVIPESYLNILKAVTQDVDRRVN